MMSTARNRRNWIWALVLLGSVQDGVSAPRTEPPTVVVITNSKMDVFEETAEGLRTSLGSSAKVVTVDLSAPDKASSDLAAQVGKDPRVVVAIGNNAVDAAWQLGVPVIATMVLRRDLSSLAPRSPTGAVVLDLSVNDILAGLLRAFPDKTRVGLIRRMNPGDPSDGVLIAQAKAVGVKLIVVDCPTPDRLLPSFLSLKAEVDLVWCPPDGTLFNGTTVKPLILASLENQLPVAGFSANFVRAGAAAGIYPDYREMGSQVGEMVRRVLAGTETNRAQATPGTVPIETPRRTRIALNQRVARLLGLRGAAKSSGTSEIAVIE